MKRCGFTESIFMSCTCILGENFIEIPSTFGIYRVVNLISQGSFSVVFLVQHLKTERNYAAKIVSRSFIESMGIIEKFEREVRILERTSHPYIVHLIEVIYTDDLFILITEYCANGALFDYIAEHGPFELKLATKVFRQIAEGIRYLHNNNFVHRDIKLENILLTDMLDARICDFSFTREVSEGKLLSSPCGSLFYAPPEVINNQKYDGKMSDIWALGVTLFAILTGKMPWVSNDPQKIIQQIKTGNILIQNSMDTLGGNLIKKLLNVDPKMRPTIDEVLADEFLFPKAQGPVSPYRNTARSFLANSATYPPQFRLSTDLHALIRRVPTNKKHGNSQKRVRTFEPF